MTQLWVAAEAELALRDGYPVRSLLLGSAALRDSGYLHREHRPTLREPLF